MEQNTPETTPAPLTDKQRWEAMLRGQVMIATTNKFSVILRMVDQKAQVMILLNSFVIPVCLRSLETHKFQEAAILSIIASALSIWAAIVCIYPKRKYRKRDDRELNLLHFNDIGHMDQDDFYNQILPKFNDPGKLSEMVVQDLYDTSRYSIIPKFVWLKISYSFFGVGNMLAILFVMAEIIKAW